MFKDKDKKYSEHSIITRDASVVNIKDDETIVVKNKIYKFLKYLVHRPKLLYVHLFQLTRRSKLYYYI